MNKSELVETIAHRADLSKASAARALEAVMDAIGETLKKGETVSLVGFGSFSVAHREARVGRNPRTGKIVQINAAKMPKFRPGKALKDVIQ